ncbi:uncharacterized protein LOC124157422 [Ischnura elegans]|uniref:uncharacterized protein LOC124157422 n=1 Tax=Ischnura elegans TaxID=197161 RepID=UPI001ED87BE1|nr:uncharacterized protein LOC124157422 [Ischnura elegans]
MDLPSTAFCLSSNSDMAVSFDEWFRPKVESLSGIVDLDSVMMKTGNIGGSGSVGGVDVLDHATQNLSEFEGFLLNDRDHRPSTSMVGAGENSESHQLDDLDNADILLQGKEHEVDKDCCDAGSNKLTFLDEPLDLAQHILMIKEEKIIPDDSEEIPVESLRKKDYSDKSSSKSCDEDLCTFNILNYRIDSNISSLEEAVVNTVSVATSKENCDGIVDKSSLVSAETGKATKAKITVRSGIFSPKQLVPKVIVPSDGRLVAADEAPEDAQIVIRNVAGEPLFHGKISELLSAAANVSGGPVSSLVQSASATSKTSTSKVPARVGAPSNVMSVLANGDSALTKTLDCASASGDGIGVCSNAVKLEVGDNPPEEADLEMAEEQDVEDDFPDRISNSKSLRRIPEDGPVTEALAELGITTETILCTLSGMSGNNGGKMWVCHAEGCHKSFPRLSMLKIHILGHYGVRPYKCDYDGCHWSFYTYFKLKRHRETHLKKKDYLCPVEGCGRRFTTIYNLHTHEKLHWRPAEMVCPVKSCGACFQTRRHLEVHLRDHDVNHAPYRCPYADCGKHYYSANSLQSHIKSHQHKEEEVRCSWEGCGKLFDKPCRLRAHMRTHTGDKPYPCLFQGCGARFSTASKLKRHQHKHTNNRRFKCGEEGCMKSFLRSEHLKEHLLKHAGVGSFHCPVQNCKVKFTAKSSLYVHLKKHKGGANNTSGQNSTSEVTSSPVQTAVAEKERPSMWLCPVEGCGRKYVNKSSLRQHLVKAHILVLGDGHPMMLMTNSVDDLGVSTVAVEGNGSSSHDLRNSYIVMGLPNGLEDEVAVITDTSFANSTVAPLTELLATRSNGQVDSTLTASPQLDENPVISTIALGEKEDVLIDTSAFVDQDGSARTSYTFSDIVRERETRRKQNQQGDETDCTEVTSDASGDGESGQSSSSSRDPVMDTVVESGSASILGVPSKDIVLPREPSPCLLLQDDLPGTLFRVSESVDGVDGSVPRESVISVGDVDHLDVSVEEQNASQLDPHQVLVPGVLSAAGFQVLLLSPPMDSPRSHDFPPESTINLRDLE